MPGTRREIGQLLMRLTQDFQQRLDADLARRGVSGIGRRHRRVFLHLARNGPCRSVDLAAAAGIRPQSMMTIVHELDELGFVRRSADPGDSRAKRIALTAGGRKLVTELARSSEAVWRQYASLAGAPLLQRLSTDMQALLEATAAGEAP
ncbi:MAG: MarR family winged helix-turn-helix transcriptional regulator [Gammaproteobacteria bacterium]